MESIQGSASVVTSNPALIILPEAGTLALYGASIVNVFSVGLQQNNIHYNCLLLVLLCRHMLSYGRLCLHVFLFCHNM